MAHTILLKTMVKWSGDEKYKPKSISVDRWYPVTGINSYSEKRKIDNKEKVVPVLKILIIDDQCDLCEVSSFNLKFAYYKGSAENAS